MVLLNRGIVAPAAPSGHRFAERREHGAIAEDTRDANAQRAAGGGSIGRDHVTSIKAIRDTTAIAMSQPPARDLTQLLQQWGEGEAAALDRLMPEVYPELRAMAARQLRRERQGTIQATVLVHDLYLRLLQQERAQFVNRRAFFGFAAAAMRHIIIDHVRAQGAQKRGARRVRVPLSDDLQFVDAAHEDILDLDQALQELATFDARKAELVQLCAFLGCGRTEAADLLGISLPTAKRDFRAARAWLAQRLQRDNAED